MSQQQNLKYGCNPHQGNARLIFEGPVSPLKILNGNPSFINILDAFQAWQLVSEVKRSLNTPCAASFKHLSPAGAAIAKPLTEEYRLSQFITEKDLSPVSTAYLRARGGDRMCSFGDAVAVSEEVDVSLANILKNEVSDLIIAPKFQPEALEILKTKKKGGYLVLEIDPDYEPQSLETRQVFGFTMQQDRNTARIDHSIFQNIVTANQTVDPKALETMVLATISLKYTQSNSVIVAYDGQLIGVGAGQQSRVHCLRLACGKADKWFLQQHPKVLDLAFNDSLKKVEKTNCVDALILWDELSDYEKTSLLSNFRNPPALLTPEEKIAFIQTFSNICLSSDAYFPFRDNIDRANRSNVKYIAHPGGSVRDDICTAAADEYGMVMYHTGVRLFTH